MDYNDTYAGEFSYHNITRSQISIDKYTPYLVSREVEYTFMKNLIQFIFKHTS